MSLEEMKRKLLEKSSGSIMSVMGEDKSKD